MAAFAILLQIVFAAPIAFRMAAADINGVPICGTPASLGLGGGDQTPLPHQPAHNHDQCLICHGHSLPLAPVTAAFVLFVALSAVAVARPPVRGRPARCRRYLPYASRAPPATA